RCRPPPRPTRCPHAALVRSYVLGRAAQQRVAARLPGDFSIPVGGVRTFLPGVQLTDLTDHLRHPMLSARSMDESRTGRMIRARRSEEHTSDSHVNSSYAVLC